VERRALVSSVLAGAAGSATRSPTIAATPSATSAIVGDSVTETAALRYITTGATSDCSTGPLTVTADRMRPLTDLGSSTYLGFQGGL
jgi:hypothetical protein